MDYRGVGCAPRCGFPRRDATAAAAVAAAAAAGASGPITVLPPYSTGVYRTNLINDGERHPTNTEEKGVVNRETNGARCTSCVRMENVQPVNTSDGLKKVIRRRRKEPGHNLVKRPSVSNFFSQKKIIKKDILFIYYHQSVDHNNTDL